MEIYQLQYFIKTAEILHFTKAAELCFVTQSGLSQQIKKLEEELGMPLFIRIGKKVKLTEAGSVFLIHAKQIIENVQSGKQAIDDLNQMIGGELRIGVTYIFGLLVLPIVNAFAKTYSNLKIVVEYGTTEPLEKKLLNNELDLVLVISSNEIELPFQKIPLFTSQLVMAVSRSNELAVLDKIPFKNIENIPLILPVKGFNSREFLDELFLKNNMKPKVSIELNAVHALLRLVEESDWATIVTEKALRDWNNLKAIQIVGVDTKRDSFILTIDGTYQKKAVKLFIEEFRKSM
ncbi:LysR substrate-binding domain-containing protein [Flavobacterium sp. Fl-77]|uniref:LysR substrate-binding domain-containing protein n=1 Tax=Flavobacterium flavipigmentatum TaxID=2893884 RepID=A0AAJ2VVE6_9FLAO|nr:MULTISPECIES: LysR substrate-binding domain-containing protein [unclassified Flavobacterium]MDX6181181.1 LysR substrate-binding domain-containing protein [Flavobacterium sp. Fl-33]MDX6184782.1 LysR substrate-binding domain-containing protein [Flavobacterium sp. Fl-77]UFH39879.1 LysR substrate-binding domain-containing protein [Flavobacterium sp. F-70]